MNTLLYVSVMQQHIICVYVVSLAGRSVDWPVNRPLCKGYNIYTYTRYSK